MPRIVKSADVRKDEILDTAQALFAERGYAHTSVQAVIDAVGISKGAFYHHFGSKSEMLDALIARLSDEAVAVLRPLVADPDVSAVDKFIDFWRRIGAWKGERRALMIGVHEGLQQDANALLLLRQRKAAEDAYAPLLASIIREGVVEGTFDTPAAEQTSRIVFQIVGTMSEAFGGAIFGAARATVSLAELEAIHEAHARAIERVLGASEGSLSLIERDALQEWLQAVSHPSPPGSYIRSLEAVK